MDTGERKDDAAAEATPSEAAQDIMLYFQVGVRVKKLNFLMQQSRPLRNASQTLKIKMFVFIRPCKMIL